MLELFSSYETAPKNSNFRIEHRRVSFLFEVFFYLTHLPLESGFIKIRHILRNQLSEDGTYFFEFFIVVTEVKFERTEGDSTIVESGHFDVGSPGVLRFRLNFFESRLTHSE